MKREFWRVDNHKGGTSGEEEELLEEAQERESDSGPWKVKVTEVEEATMGK